MVEVTGKLGSWEVPTAHMWKDRGVELRMQGRPMVGKQTRVATIGSCFAAELVAGMKRRGLAGQMHPGGLFYTSRSIRQEFERIFVGQSVEEPLWQVRGGWVHPFQEPGRSAPSQDQLLAACAEVDAEAASLFRSAEVVVVTLGLIEAWVSPFSGWFYRQLPHPDVFSDLKPVFTRLTVTEIREDLERIWSLLGTGVSRSLVITVSPVPLHVTFTSSDVRTANMESKCRLRAAVSEFVEEHPEVVYFPSFELAMTAERLSDFMKEDGRHLHQRAVDYIVATFLRNYGSTGMELPVLDLSWLAGPEKTAARVERRRGLMDLIRRGFSAVAGGKRRGSLGP